MKKSTETFRCYHDPDPDGGLLCAWYQDRDKHPFAYVIKIKAHWLEYHALDYPPGTTLTITIDIQTPDAPKLDDEAAGKLNQYMNGEG